MGNNSNSRVINHNLPVAIPIMIPVVDSVPLNDSISKPHVVRVRPSAPPLETPLTPSAPPLEEPNNSALYRRALTQAIESSLKVSARDMLALGDFTNEELMEYVRLIDRLMVRYPKNKTRPIIRNMIMKKINENNKI